MLVLHCVNALLYGACALTLGAAVDVFSLSRGRVRAILAAKAKGLNPYPHKFHAGIQLPQYVKKYASLADGEQRTDESVSLAGGARTGGLRREGGEREQGGRDDMWCWAHWRRLSRHVQALDVRCCVGCETSRGGVILGAAGRVSRKAASGSKLIFFDLRSEGVKIQVMCDAR